LSKAPITGVTRRQVTDLRPPPPPWVTEYQIVTRTCPGCAAHCTAPAPACAAARASYGPAVLARAAELLCAHYLPVGRATQLMGSLLGVRVSTGFMAGVRHRAAVVLEQAFLPRVRTLLRQVGVLHADETPGRAAGGLDPDAQLWAAAMADTLTDAHHRAQAARAAGHDTLDPEALAMIRNHYRGAAELSITTNNARAGPLAADALRLAQRFRNHEDMILRFVVDLAVPWTNNQAERDVRPVKIQQRTSGGAWRTLDGIADFAVVQYYLSTATKWGLDTHNVLTQLFATGAWLPPPPAPLNSYGVSFVVDQHPVGAFGADAADEPFRITVRPGRPRRDLGLAVTTEQAAAMSCARGEQEATMADPTPATIRLPLDLTRFLPDHPGDLGGSEPQLRATGEVATSLPPQQNEVSKWNSSWSWPFWRGLHCSSSSPLESLDSRAGASGS